MAAFAAAFDPVSRLARSSPGFLWQLRSHTGHVIQPDDSGRQIFVNVSVWESYEDLHAFVYRSGHGPYLRHRSRWFLPTQQPSTVLWWVDADERPNAESALQRLKYLRTYGPSPQAFSLLRQFDEHDRPIARRGAREARA